MKPSFALAAAILVQLPRSTRAFVIRIWHGTPPILTFLLNIIHSWVLRAKKFLAQSKKGPDLWSCARADALVHTWVKFGSKIGDETA
jgi:hypothetical protein